MDNLLFLLLVIYDSDTYKSFIPEEDYMVNQTELILDVEITEAGYESNKATISNISIRIHKGELLGLIGPNGAGKSTTIKTIMNITPYHLGNVQIGGQSGTFAYVPEQPIYYDYFTLWEHLLFAASVNGLDQKLFESRAELLLEKFKLTEQKHHYPSSFSKGMKQKFMLIIAFMLEPDLYIVDEPFVGLDPQATLDFLALLNEARANGAGVLMSTHVLDTAEKICDSFVLIHNGKIMASGTLSDIKSQSNLNEHASLFQCFQVLTSDVMSC